MNRTSKGISLKGLEVFCAVATRGSIQAAGKDVGLSLPAASQQIKKLENELGCALLVHDTRPMALTSAGKMFLKRAEEVLRQVRLGAMELNALDVTGLSSLKIGIIEDFENDITPLLVRQLSTALSQCEFRQVTGPSHVINEMVAGSELDIGICSVSDQYKDQFQVAPILRDPYVLAVPNSLDHAEITDCRDLEALQYISYDRRYVVGRQIEAQLARLKINLNKRVEMDSNQSIMALVARDMAWTITTPLAYFRAQRFRQNVRIQPLPFPRFSREISLICNRDWVPSVAQEMAMTLRRLMHDHILTPVIEELPWLSEDLRIISEVKR